MRTEQERRVKSLLPNQFDWKYPEKCRPLGSREIAS
jgi:hypothetical protein